MILQDLLLAIIDWSKTASYEEKNRERVIFKSILQITITLSIRYNNTTYDFQGVINIKDLLKIIHP